MSSSLDGYNILLVLSLMNPIKERSGNMHMHKKILHKVISKVSQIVSLGGNVFKCNYFRVLWDFLEIKAGEATKAKRYTTCV
jgi:hypothetical protein